MAFTSIGNRGTALSSGNNQASLALAVNANVAAGRLLVVIVAVDNLVTTSGAVTTANAMTSGVTDAAGNVYTLARGQTQGTVSQTGAEVTVWYTVATTQLNSGQNVTATFRTPANADASAMTAWEFSVGAGNGVAIDGATGTGSSTTVGSLDVTTASAERLRIRGMAHEHNLATGMTPTASWTAFTAAVSGAGTSATEMAVRGEFRIVTGTGAASNPTGIASVNNASAYVALAETVGYSDTITPATIPIDGANIGDVFAQIEPAITADALPITGQDITPVHVPGSSGGPVFLRPNDDAVDGNWLNQAGSNTNLFDSLDETVASDTDYIQSPANPVNETCKIALSDPGGALAEPFIVRYRFNNIGGAELTVRLLQGTTEIASWVETEAGWNTKERTLSSPQFAAITDFSDLFVELKANTVTPAALDLDFTTGTLDSRVTFTRSTTATRINASGLVEAMAVDAPRFDYDPITLAARGLLLEEQRTNLALQSETFSGYAAEATATFNSTASPTGAVNATKLVSNGSSQTRFYMFHTTTAGIVHTISVFVKKDTAAFFWVDYSDSAGSHFTWFNLTTGAVATKDASVTAKIEAFPNGWFRCSATRLQSGTTFYVMFGISDADSSMAATNGVTGAWVYGAQFEIGDFATSYIPTTSAAVTRAADSAVMTGTNFSSWWNASAGTFVASFDGPASGTRPIISADDNTASEVIMLYGSGTDPKAVVTDGGATQADLDAGTLVANTVAKLGFSFAVNDFAACLNGGTVATDTGGTLPTVTQARLGAGPASNYLNGHLASLKFYNVAKSDAELQALTS